MGEIPSRLGDFPDLTDTEVSAPSLAKPRLVAAASRRSRTLLLMTFGVVVVAIAGIWDAQRQAEESLQQFTWDQHLLGVALSARPAPSSRKVKSWCCYTAPIGKGFCFPTAASSTARRCSTRSTAAR